jgi:phosphoribosylaminoimidazole carboxylase/phosphoribosylaminoimidazole-succinocarboxamide synthase
MTALEASLSRPPSAEGKTKKIFEAIGNPPMVIVVSKDDITAGDGAKHDIIKDKGKLANQTTCNVFRLLKECGIPVAFHRQIDPIPAAAPESFVYGFEAMGCAMLPYEVVIRREAHGSYLKRAPHLVKGHVFPRLVLEFFLKTSGMMWKGHPLECDDPYMIHNPATKRISLYNPKQPDLAQNPATTFLELPEEKVFRRNDEAKLIGEMGAIARRVFLILEKAWQLQGQKLVDLKVEFGIGSHGELLLADVIDNDSWRVVDGSGGYIDKQVYRDGADLGTVTAKYRQVAELTGQFMVPLQRLTFWRGSENDDLGPFYEPLVKLGLISRLETPIITCSIHKQPGVAYRILQQHLQEVPDTVIVAYIGRSNGAGPTLSANATVPVITVPANYVDFPEDVWSSLRTPSSVPVMTVLGPANATMAALQILAMRNPLIYAVLRYDQETRLTEI